MSPDLLMTRLGLDGYDPQAREAVKALQFDMADQALRAGASVVLDSGFLHRHERDDAQAMAQAWGAEFRRVFLNPVTDVLWQRLQARNAALPSGTFPVTKEHLALCETWLEPPSPDEPLWRPGSC
ncbi:MAG: kinase [Pseudorhodobacter sp. PARRP1]|nr:MAG: kinase [Pseudorhodobacter sp. PARRP1]